MPAKTQKPKVGYCPRCGAAGSRRERRPNGNDVCVNGHRYPSHEAHSHGAPDGVPEVLMEFSRVRDAAGERIELTQAPFVREMAYEIVRLREELRRRTP